MPQLGAVAVRGYEARLGQNQQQLSPAYAVLARDVIGFHVRPCVRLEPFALTRIEIFYGGVFYGGRRKTLGIVWFHQVLPRQITQKIVLFTDQLGKISRPVFRDAGFDDFQFFQRLAVVDEVWPVGFVGRFWRGLGLLS